MIKKQVKENILFIFKKDYKSFEKGQYLEIPIKRFSGQINIEIIWREVENLLNNKILSLVE